MPLIQAYSSVVVFPADIDECLLDNNCDQECVDELDGYSCGCYDGFRLADDAVSCIGKYISHTFLIDNHVRLHSSQNASYTGDVCDMHQRLTAKPHLCVICGTFHTEVNTHLLLCSTHNLLIKRQKGLNLYIQVEHFSPCDRSDDISISGSEAPPIY